jgi:hypothetical protein
LLCWRRNERERQKGKKVKPKPKRKNLFQRKTFPCVHFVRVGKLLGERMQCQE